MAYISHKDTEEKTVSLTSAPSLILCVLNVKFHWLVCGMKVFLQLCSNLLLLRKLHVWTEVNSRDSTIIISFLPSQSIYFVFLLLSSLINQEFITILEMNDNKEHLAFFFSVLK